MDWISVEDRLPENTDTVMIATLRPPIRRDLAVEVGFYTGRNWFVTDGGGWSEPRYKVLYWLPTPKAPDTPDKYHVSR